MSSSENGETHQYGGGKGMRVPTWQRCRTIVPKRRIRRDGYLVVKHDRLGLIEVIMPLREAPRHGRDAGVSQYQMICW